MMMLRDAERKVYETAWGVEGYAETSPGEQLVMLFTELAPERGTVLDAGCGQGRGAVALRQAGYRVACVDLTADALLPEVVAACPFVSTPLWDDLAPVAYLANLWDPTNFDPEAFDYVYCCDVLEHVPTALTMLVVGRLLAVARRGVFLSISLVPDVFGHAVGEPLHKTVESFEWWKQHLGEVGVVREARDLQTTAVFWVERRVG